MDTSDQTQQYTAEPDPLDLPRQRETGPEEPQDTVPGPARVRAGTTAASMIRTSHAERDEALRSLATHFAEGRLETAEFDARADVALAARTRADLRRLFTDLPGGSPAALLDQPLDDRAMRYPRSGRRGPGRPDRPYQQRDRRSYRRGFGGPPAVGRRLTILAAVLLAAAFGALRHGYFPFPLIPALFILIRRPWRWN
jgi:hypothetical protein